MKRILVAPMAATLVLLGSMSLGRTEAEAAPTPECKLAAEWVAINADHLPSTLGELDGFSLAYRRAIYNALPETTRATLWESHLQRMMDSEPLTAEQREFVASIRDNIASILTAEAESKTFEAAALAVFEDRAQVWRIFGVLGIAPQTTAAALAKSCSCNDDSMFGCNSITGPSEHCHKGLEGCSASSDGCGWMWNYTCNGRCDTTHSPT